MNIDEIQDEIIEEFEFLNDWVQRYEHIIALGKSLSAMEDKYKTDDNLIRGCQSKVWLYAEKNEGKMRFKADSNAVLTKGIMALLLRVYSNQTTEDILSSNLYFIDKIGIKEHLSPIRSNGLLIMVKQIKLYALGFQVKE